MVRLGISPINRVNLDSLVSDMIGRAEGSAIRLQELPTDIYEAEDCYYLETELPGVKDEDIELFVKGGEVTLTVSSPKVELVEGLKLKHRERTNEGRSRTFRFGQDLNPSAVEAKLKDGVLSVKLPKHEDAKGRKIAVTAH